MNEVIKPDILGNWWLLRQKTTAHFDFGQLKNCALKDGVWTFHVYGRIETTLQDKKPYSQISFLEQSSGMGVIFAAARAMDFSTEIRGKPGPKKSLMFSMDRDEHAFVRARAPRPKIKIKVRNCETLILSQATDASTRYDDGDD